MNTCIAVLRKNDFLEAFRKLFLNTCVSILVYAESLILQNNQNSICLSTVRTINGFSKR